MMFLFKLWLTASICSVAADGSKLRAASQQHRNLNEFADWHVTINSVTDQGFAFETGAGAGSAPHIQIEFTDKCRRESPRRKDIGECYPKSNIKGISCNGAGVINNPGKGNSIDFKFVEGINGNKKIYKDNGDNTATVKFCVGVGLYESKTLIDFAEIRYSYNIDLVTNAPSLIDYEITHH